MKKKDCNEKKTFWPNCVVKAAMDSENHKDYYAIVVFSVEKIKQLYSLRLKPKSR